MVFALGRDGVVGWVDRQSMWTCMAVELGDSELLMKNCKVQTGRKGP